MTLKDVLISGKFTGNVTIGGAHMSLKDMLIAAKLYGGSSPVPVANKYITSDTETTITLPFGPQPTYKITFDLYEGTGGENFEEVCSYNGSRTGSITVKTQSGIEVYRGNWTYFNVNGWARYTPITQIILDFVTKKLSCVAGGETYTKEDTGAWPQSDNPYVLRLSSIKKVKGITVESDGVVIHDLIATDDGGACLKDLVTGICYYDANSTAYLIDDPQ